MLREICGDNGVSVKEAGISVSDGVILNVYDFYPENYDKAAPVLVFVAGWVSLIKGWRDVLRVLVPECRVLYIETREKKSAVMPAGKWPEFSVSRMAKDVDEVICEMLSDSTPFCIAGSSLGSTIALHYLSCKKFRQPEVSMLISPIGEVNFPFWAKIIIDWFPPSAYSVIKHIIIWYLNTFRVDKKKEPEQAEKYRGTVGSAEPKRLQANARALYNYSIWDKLSQIVSRVVIIGARTDKLHGLETLERMISLIPDASLEVMAGNKETHSEIAGKLMAEYIEGKK